MAEPLTLTPKLVTENASPQRLSVGSSDQMTACIAGDPAPKGSSSHLQTRLSTLALAAETALRADRGVSVKRSVLDGLSVKSQGSEGRERREGGREGEERERREGKQREGEEGGREAESALVTQTESSSCCPWMQ